jgi:hypothetical protein
VLLLAHAADWIEALMLGLPAIAFGAWLALTQWRERRRRGGSETG